MKPTVREDLTSIAAIGAGAFASGILTAVLLGGAPGHDAQVHVDFVEEPRAVIQLGATQEMAGPEGPHSGWFPEGEMRVLHVPMRIEIESPSGRVVIQKPK